MIGSGAGNVAFIDGRASTDGTIVAAGSTTTITFGDTGQVLTLTGVQHLYFTDEVYST
ncbi:prepilin-type processing-associated H-X9-DG domain-containing protein [Bradyrhizobium sp. Gha]|nr:prepilin-type processing-associated H-X9-DG domain-containing protein [Bradyrhizobium sp. Gha]